MSDEEPASAPDGPSTGVMFQVQADELGSPAGSGSRAWVRAWLRRHHRKLWWLHSLYALMLGAFVVTFAQKGLVYVRWVTLFLVAMWGIIVLVFRVAGSGREQRLETQRDKVRFLLMTYVLKNLFQGMLFFLLPFYWKTATTGAGNWWFVIVLAASALLATLDVIFDRVLMRWRLAASIYFGIALFACLNLAIPALLRIPAIWALSLAAVAASIGFFTLHFPLRDLRSPKLLLILIFTTASAWGVAYAGRRAIPPVPLVVAHAAVGPEILPDGRLALEVTTLHTDWVKEMIAVTDVQTLADSGEDFVHVWRHSDAVVWRLIPTRTAMGSDRIRLQSMLRTEQLPLDRVGQWSVDIETTAGQLVGRHAFTVIE
ncbi:MAG: hypothetical protein ACI9U2_001020 [Bradymonadia bacterium]|jgi:hypothetical protein